MALNDRTKEMFLSRRRSIQASGLTPYILVDANYPNTTVPRDYVQNGRITLNISNEAAPDFYTQHNTIYFDAEFDAPIGITAIVIPIHAIIAIYAYETGEGTAFLEEDINSNLETDIQDEKPRFTLVE